MLGPERGDPGELQAFSEPVLLGVKYCHPPWLFQKLSEIRAHSRIPLPGSVVIGGPLPHLSTPQLPGKKARCPSFGILGILSSLGFLPDP